MLEAHRTFGSIPYKNDYLETTQATGPLRSDAGVGIGMLRGISLLSAN